MTMSQSEKQKDRKQTEKDAKRNAIILAARKVFYEKGFMDATMEEIAVESGFAKGTIYLYFKSKEELYVTLMATGMGLLKMALEKSASMKMRPEERLGKLMEGYYGFYVMNPMFFRIMFLSSQPDMRAKVSDELLRSSVDTGKECLGFLAESIREGIDAGKFRDVDPWTTANVMWATINGIIMLYEQDPICRDVFFCMGIEELMKSALDIALHGIEAKVK